ncbi:bifunctional riboflavin kinase/FAD synthetase [Flavobacteriaceae bacterium]|nr:bifunctional riboflavin kinase/FAD synthetase [Flavobacteriaceae bacterium]MDB4715592.1 bifunctional riboflavin kinase/FAD synthetase [Flavobacteriaceae bacterium]
MKIVSKIENYKEDKACHLTIGTFDGVHIGHQKIIQNLVKKAKSKGDLAVVLTFFPHPRMVLQKDSGIKLIDSLEDKQKILASLGVDVLVVHPFSKEFSRLTATEFTRDILVNTFNISKVIIGYDHRFGRNRDASIVDLHEFGRLYGFEVEEIPAQEIASVNVSSTKIRKALEAGDIQKVNRYLSRPYLLSGKVESGAGIGRTIEFPTANIKIKEDYKLCPPNGVYRIQSEIKGSTVLGMMNIGVRPTVGGNIKKIEVHFFSYDEDLYNENITIQILDKIRDEIKFDSLENLQNQLKKDKINCIRLFDSERSTH